VIAARDVTRGKQLVEEINARLSDVPICKNGDSYNTNQLPVISFIEYHADNPQSALDLASSAEDLVKSSTDIDKRISVLINNAGVMGKSKQLTMKVNLLGPVLLTLVLMPLLDGSSNENESSTRSSFVINVGSSAHLRATHVVDEDIILGKNETYVNAISNASDTDLSTYAQSKLALMQFSTLLRHSLSKSNSSITIYDAHPGLVWTPLLRNHIGDRATNILRKTGLAHLMYKTPLEGAQAIVAALDCRVNKIPKEQIYFENGQPGGHATPESRDFSEALRLWKIVIAPEVKGVTSLTNELFLDK
jgi:NAD(P)-dependent dehydrogenase (short-subunit alcohol dehydrogenase family)